MKLTFGEIKNLFPDHTLTMDNSEPVQGICRDSRTIRKGDIYTAIRGENFDGHIFLNDCFNKGAKAAFVAKDFRGERNNLVRVDDVVLAMGKLAAYCRGKFDQPVIAITGSNGKTTTKKLLAHVLGSQGCVIASEGNLNNHIGVPVTVFSFDAKAQYFIVEMGMSHPGEIKYLTEIVRPNLAVITSVGQAHLEGVGGTLHGVANAKGELFAALKGEDTAFVYDDDPYISAMGTKAARVTYGFSNGCDLQAKDIKTVDDGTVFTVEREQHEVSVRINMTGKHNVQNALAVFAVASHLGLPDDVIVDGLKSFRIDFNRGRRLCYQNAIVIDDTYNANPDSMMASFNSLFEEYPDSYTIGVLGGMLELGKQSLALHVALGEFLKQKGLNELLVYGAHAEGYLTGFGYSSQEAKKRLFETHGDLAAVLKDTIGKKEKVVVMLKGSRGMTMEKVLTTLQSAV
ncbi:MAG: UDP-N-acetylmuramoyl-tripeptide--D-alanyl-D-alanine ligase [Deltaproteobacteria bacterium]|nr:UDP-N-acetylmuramoyl-tripeptide--D-alanyl-D-alanine ligase [Deltaproteobacteria bacterium]